MTGQGREAYKKGAAAAEANSGGDGHFKLFELLRQEHDKARELFRKIEKSSNKEVETREELFKRMEQELLLHMEAEERFVYSALEQHDESREKVLEGYEEHLVARTVIGAFTSLAVDDERWPAKLKVLRNLVLQHMEAEEVELFPQAGELLEREQLDAILAKIRQLKDEAKKNPPVTRRAGGDTDT